MSPALEPQPHLVQWLFRGANGHEILIDLWPNGDVTAAWRSHKDAVWGPPMDRIEQKVEK